MNHRHLPTRKLREHPDLAQLKRQAKELLDALRARDAAAIAEVNAHYRDPGLTTFALHDAQLVLARSYGFESWPKLKAYVEGVTIHRLAEAVRAGDTQQVTAMLKARPELANLQMADNNEHRAIHHAVLARRPEMVRLLMRHGADARKGIYPHRGATTALQLAADREYAEIVAVILEEEQQRRHGSAASPVSKSDEFTAALRAAVANGDVEWLRARQAEGVLANPIEDSGGLLTIAARYDRPDVLKLLLDFGFDPNERMRLEDLDGAQFSAGMPLWHCAQTGKYELAQILLQHGADPNVHVYASGSAVYSAYSAGDMRMVELLRQHGGIVDPITAALFHEKELARQMLASGARDRSPDDHYAGETFAEHLLWGAACSGDVEIVRAALDFIDWPRDDAHWYEMLDQPLRSWSRQAESHDEYVECFRRILERCDPNVPHPRIYRTILHDVAAARAHVPDEAVTAFATLLLDAGARIDVRDELLKSTPLGWACRWGRVELAKLLVARGADRVEAAAEPWATPRAWAAKHTDPGTASILSGILEDADGQVHE